MERIGHWQPHKKINIMKETMIEIRELEASEGMVLTDGTTYAKSVYLAPSAKVEDWWEIPEGDVPQTDSEPNADEYKNTEPEE